MATSVCTTTSHELPPEVIEDVLGYVRDDKGSLLACTVVNSAFLGASRIHLFHSVTLDVRRNPDKLREFSKWLDTVPYTTRYIRALEVGQASLSCGADYTPIALGELLEVLDKLPVLQDLRLSDVCWNSNKSTDSTAVAARYPNIKRLEYCMAYRRNHSSCSYLFDLIPHFPSVQTLYVTGGSFPLTSMHQCSIPFTPELEDLTFDFMNSTYLLQSLLPSSSAVHLKSLSVATGPLKDVLQLVACASNISTLTELRVRLGYHDYTLRDPELLLAELNRFPCNALSVLTLEVPRFATGLFRHAFGILAHLIAPNLSVVTMLTAELSYSLCSVDWSGWEKALAKFPHLRKVSFLVPELGHRSSNSDFPRDGQRVIRQHLPELDEKGFLNFVAVGDGT
ncbi:hypothetical protein EIP86_001694 [Pleurotus ostreatoroseus]|nr:hypothetical protein EIP86_001694 [Pleurotus ostreatoroseus]